MKNIMMAVMALATLCSCVGSEVIRGSGRQARGEFDIDRGYTSISVSSGIEVVFTAGGEGGGGGGVITADENVLDHVSIAQNNGRVTIGYAPGVTVVGGVKTVVTLPVSPFLAQLNASSAARVTSERRLVVSSLSVTASAAAEIELDIDAQDLTLDIDSAARFEGNVVVRNLTANIDSASRCQISGSAEHADIEADSAAGFRGVELVCRYADARADSAGVIEITATEELNADASSGGAVRYKGSPVVLRRNTSSGGAVREII